MSSQTPRQEGFPGQRLIVLPTEVVKRLSGLPVTRDLTVTHLGHFVTAPGHFVERPKGARQWVLIYCLAGAGFAKTGDSRFDLAGGDLILLPPGAGHRYGAAENNPWSIFWVHFTGRRAGDYPEALGWTPASPLLHVPDTKVMLDAFEDLHWHTLHGMSDAEMLALGTSFARLLGLARLGTRARERKARQIEDKILRVVARLREEPQLPWTVAEMAGLVSMSQGHFNELFRRQTGSPPMTFLIRLRLQLACRILDQEHESVERTANRVGYEDPFYFSRLFRRHLGVSPSRFRHDAGAGRGSPMTHHG